MTQIAATLFFMIVFVGAAMALHLTVRSHWAEIIAALRGEVSPRHVSRPWTSRVRVTTRPPAQAKRAAMVQRAAS